MRHRSGLLWLGLVLGVALTARAQITSGTISGTVKDSTGAVVPGAKVVVLNEETGISRTATSDGAGRYVAPSLGLGRYRVTASLEGFQTQVRSGIEITLSREAVVNFDLPVGAITQTVEVTGEAPLVDTMKGGMGVVLGGSAISELPLNGRDIASLVMIQTGAMQYTGSMRTGEGGKQIVVSGSRPTTNVFLMDGIAIEAYNQKTPTGNSGNFLGVEAVREFRVESNAYSAEFGRGSGGQFNIATKSGTNAFHGSLFEFLRNDNLDAAKWEDNAFGNGKPEFKRNQFGGSIGGPLVKDNTFFFGTYEGYRERLGTTIVSNTFSAGQRQGLLTNPQTGQVRQVEIDPRVRPYLTVWPLPNGRILPDGTGEYTSAFSQPTNEDFVQIRVDHKLSGNDSIFARHTFLDSRQQLPSQGAVPQFSLDETVRNQYTTIEESHIFSPHFLNTFRAGFTRTNPLEAAREDPVVDPSLYFVPGVPQLGLLSVVPLSDVGNGITGDRRTMNSFQWIDDARYTRGRHSLKFGMAWDRLQFNGFNPARDAGNYTFNSIEDFFIARVNRFRGAIAVGFNDPSRSVRENIIGLYFQDDFQVLPRLTLNLGLRYEFITVPVENHGRVGILRGDLNFIQHATVNDIHLGNPWFENPSKKNFAPRFGFAWDVLGNGKMAVRGGFGIFHLQFNQSWIRTTAFRMPPFLVETQAAAVGNQAVPFPNIFQLCGRDNPFVPRDPRCVGRPAPDMLPYNMRTPYMMQYNFNLQRQLLGSTVVTVGYVGSRGVSLPAAGDLNQAVAQNVNGRLFFPATARRPNPNFDDIRYRYPVASSFYNSLQLSVKRSFGQGLQLGSSYTFSRTIDDNSGSQTAGDTDSGPNWIYYYADKSLNRGLANFDARHAFTFNSTYELPLGPGRMFGGGLTGVAKAALGGWQFGGIVTLVSGIPGTVSIANRLTALGMHNEVPDLAPGASNNPTRPGNPNQYIDAAAFLFPADRTLGNLGRNTVTLPGLANFDFSLTKNTAITEASRLQFRFETFNLFNRVNFAIPQLEAFNNRGVPRADLGRITTTKTTARQLQFGLKYIF